MGRQIALLSLGMQSSSIFSSFFVLKIAAFQMRLDFFGSKEPNLYKMDIICHCDNKNNNKDMCKLTYRQNEGQKQKVSGLGCCKYN